jgi:transposase
MILELHRQGLSLAAIARRTGMDRATVAKYVKRGLEPPCYGPRNPRPTVITPVEAYLRERVAAFPDLNGSRLLREIRERGYMCNGGTLLGSGALGDTAIWLEVRGVAPIAQHPKGC